MAKTQTTTSRQRPDNASAQAAGTAQVADDAERRAADRARDKAQPKQYRATARGYVDGRIVEAGELFTTAEPEGSWMEPVKNGTSSSERLQRAVDDTLSPMSDDPDLSTFSKAALEAKALDLGLTNASGLTKEDLIQAIQSAHDEDRAR